MDKRTDRQQEQQEQTLQFQSRLLSFEPAWPTEKQRKPPKGAAGTSGSARSHTHTHTHIKRAPVRRGVVVVVVLLMNLFRILNSNADSKLAYYNQLPLNNRWALIVSKIGCSSRVGRREWVWVWAWHHAAFGHDAIAIRVRTSSLIN